MKHFFSKRKKRFARIISVVLILTMVFAFSTSALAAQNQPSGSDSPGRSGNSHEDHDTGNGNSPDGNGRGNTYKNGADGKRDYNGINVDKIRLAIESVADETQKAELTTLLDAYLSTLDAKASELASGLGGSLSALSQAAADARSALKTALENAGFTLGSILGWQEFKLGYTHGDAALNLEVITAEIAALDDTDANKDALLALLSEYQTALDAQATAGEGLDLVALEEAVKTAKENLVEALNAVGILPLLLQDQDMSSINDPVASDDPIID